MSTSNLYTGRVIAAAALLPALFFAVSSHPASAADVLAQATPTATAPATAAPPSSMAAKDMRAAERVEARITDLHKKLAVTPDQEPLWTDVAQTMRDSEKKMRASLDARSSNLKTMNAIDDLKSYRMIADEHAEGLKHLIPVFEALYAKMTPAQQKNADHVFAAHQQHGHRPAKA